MMERTINRVLARVPDELHCPVVSMRLAVTDDTQVTIESAKFTFTFNCTFSYIALLSCSVWDKS